jgi:hypothetical protein
MFLLDLEDTLQVLADGTSLMMVALDLRCITWHMLTGNMHP